MHKIESSERQSSFPFHRALTVPLLGLVLLMMAAPPDPASAQEREVVFSQVTVAGGEATLALEFDDGQELSVVLRDERVLVNETEIGRYGAGGPLERAWRSLLGQAVAMDSREIGPLLRDWSPPAELEGDARAAAEALHDRLASELARPAEPEVPTIRPEGDLQEAIEALILRTDRLRALTSGLRGLRTEGLRVYVGDDVVIGEEETVEGSLLVLDGHLTLNGHVEGDVLLLGGELTLGEGGSIGGELRWIDAIIDEEHRDAVAGSISEIQPVPDRSEAELRDEIRREVQAALQARPRAERPSTPVRFQLRSGLQNLATGLARLFQTLVTFGILFGIGLALLYFMPRNFEVVARTARHATGRSALVGLAASILSLPIWVAGIVLLAITVIGIPVMLLWMPLFPLALALAATAGFLAVARIVGRWMSDRSIRGFESLDASRPAIQLGTGLAVLMAAFVLAAVFQMGGAWLSLFHGILSFIGILLVVVSGMIGLGAVVLSRGGREPLYAGPGWSWGGGMDPWGSDPDPFGPGPDASPPPPNREPSEASGADDPHGPGSSRDSAPGEPPGAERRPADHGPGAEDAPDAPGPDVQPDPDDESERRDDERPI